MDIETMKAYEWALNQNFGSVAAQYAKKLALYIQSAKSTTSEEVQEALEQMNEALSREYLESDGEWTCYNDFSTNAIRTAISALQQMRTEPF